MIFTVSTLCSYEERQRLVVAAATVVVAIVVAVAVVAVAVVAVFTEFHKNCSVKLSAKVFICILVYVCDTSLQEQGHCRL